MQVKTIIFVLIKQIYTYSAFMPTEWCYPQANLESISKYSQIQNYDFLF